MLIRPLSREHLAKRQKERGFTLMETLLVIAIVAVVIAGAFALYNVAMSDSDVNQSVSEVQSISTRIQKAYNVSGSPYSSLTTQAGINIGVFPEGMIRGTTVYNTWNGMVTLTGTATTFTITYTNVPQSSCASFAASSGNIGESLVQVAVNGTGITPPVDPATAGAACSQTNNTIIWTLR